MTDMHTKWCPKCTKMMLNTHAQWSWELNAVLKIYELLQTFGITVYQPTTRQQIYACVFYIRHAKVTCLPTIRLRTHADVNLKMHFTRQTRSLTRWTLRWTKPDEWTLLTHCDKIVILWNQKLYGINTVHSHKSLANEKCTL